MVAPTFSMGFPRFLLLFRPYCRILSRYALIETRLGRVTSYFIQSYVPYPERNVIDGWVAVLTFERALRLNDHFV